MRNRLHMLAPLSVCFAVACQATGPLLDQRPDHIPKEQVESTVWIGPTEASDEPTFRTFGHGSGVIIGPHALLTNAHVWVNGNPEARSKAKHRVIGDEEKGVRTASGEETPWWMFTLPQEGELAIATHRRDVSPAGRNRTRTLHTRALRTQEFRLAASGLSDDGEHLDDWVVLVTDEPGWGPGNIAPVYPPAMDPEWRAPEGTELFQVGFASVFQQEGDPDDPDTTRAFIQNGPYALPGRALGAASRVGSAPLHKDVYQMTQPRGRSLIGHSGGGVYLWNADTSRLELVGINSSGSFVQLDVRILGLDIGFKTTLETASNYIPISMILGAVKEAEVAVGLQEQ